MIDSSEQTLWQYRVGELRILELSRLPHGRSWILWC
jgi:hypothetical protein